MKTQLGILFSVALLLVISTITYVRRNSSGAWMVYTWRTYKLEKGEIHLMSGDGRWERNLTSGPACGDMPQWSPDGVWIVYTSDCDDSVGDLLRLRPISSIPQSVSSEIPFAIASQWSSDSKRLLVTRTDPELFIVGVDSGHARHLASDYRDAQWSPDSEWIYAHPVRNRQSSLDRIHVETGRVETVLPANPRVVDMDWSPEVTEIVLTTQGENGDELARLATNSSTLTTIPVDLPELQFDELRWSPDGEWIALGVEGPDFSQHIYRIRPDGSDVQRLTKDALRGRVENLQWSPDAQWLLFAAGRRDDGMHIYRLRADGSFMENLTPGSYYETAPQYAPTFGLTWHPTLMLIGALGMLATSTLIKSLDIRLFS